MNTKREVKSKNVQIRLRPAEYEDLKELAERLNFLSLSELIRFCLKNQLEKHKVRSYA